MTPECDTCPAPHRVWSFFTGYRDKQQLKTGVPASASPRSTSGAGGIFSPSPRSSAFDACAFSPSPQRLRAAGAAPSPPVKHRLTRLAALAGVKMRGSGVATATATTTGPAQSEEQGERELVRSGSASFTSCGSHPLQFDAALCPINIMNVRYCTLAAAAPAAAAVGCTG